MKKIVLTLFLFLVIAAAKSQPTLTQANQAPAVGNVFVSYVADTSAQPGSAGANQTWTFSSLNITSTTIVQSFVTPSSTPYASSFPAANVANSIMGSYEYLTSSSSSLILRGAYSGGGNTTFTNTCTEFTYPFTYNTSVSNSSLTGTFTAGTFTGSSSTLGDAHGTLVINGRTYSNVLRVKVIQSIDFDYGSMGHLISNTATYYWYDGTHKNPLLEISTSNSTGVVTGHSKFVYVSDFATGVSDVSDLSFHLDVFPNPSKGKVCLQFENDNRSHITVSLYNTMGSLVLQKDLGELSPAPHTEPIDLENVSKGIYVMVISTGEAKTARRIAVE